MTRHTVNRFVGACAWQTALFAGLTLVTSAWAVDDAWLRVTTPDFTVITSLREKEAVAWTRDFEQYVAALRDFFHRGGGQLPPLTVVFFARERDFAKYRPLGANGKAQEVAGFFLRHESWAVIGLAGTGGSDEVRRKIFHEGVHWFLSLQERPNPVWLEEGLAEVFSTFKVVKGEASWGQAIDAHVQLLRYQSMLPLERVMATGRENLFGDDSMHTSTVYAESWAFVHFLLFGQQGVRRRALADYSEFSHTMKPDEAFRRAFEKTYREMDLLLEDYLRDGAYYTRHQPLATVAPPKVEVAERLDVEDALGRLALAARRWDLAASHARAAITAVPASPRGHEILGLSLKENGDTSGALAEFELAASRDTRDFQPFFELGLAAQNAAVGPFGDLGSMTPGEARRIANYYERAINLHPRFHSSYQNLAGVIGMAEAAGSADRAFLDQGRKLFPEDAMVRVGLALLAQRAGDRAGARELLATVLSDENAEPASARGYARRTEAMWDQQEISDQIDRLIGAQKFAEVVALIDERLARGVAPELRVQLVPLRQRMVAGVLSQRIQLAMESGRWADARRYLAELIASSAPEPLKIQARRSLEELDRKRLGLDGAKK